MTIWQKLCEQLVQAIEDNVLVINDHKSIQDLIVSTRAALAKLEPKQQMSVDEIAKILLAHSSTEPTMGTDRIIYQSEIMPAAEEIYERMAELAKPELEPVPVSERPWEREGWCDREGRCALFSQSVLPELSTWILAPAAWASKFPHIYSHALPHWALPVPTIQDAK